MFSRKVRASFSWILVLLFSLSLLVIGCSDDDDDDGNPVSGQSLSEKFGADLQTMLEENVASIVVPGALLYVVDNTGDSWCGITGIMEADDLSSVMTDGWQGTALDNTNIHTRIGSMTKTFTAEMMYILMDNGDVSLDGVIDDYLPDYEVDIPNSDIITIRNLLDMRSGLICYTQLPDLEVLPFPQYEPSFLLQAVVNAGGTLNGPDESFYYCNTNYVILGLIIEEITGMAAYEAIQQYILTPLGMDNTQMPAPEDDEMPTPFWYGYSYFGEEIGWYDLTTQNVSWAWTAGNMISDRHDMATWIDAFLSPTLISQETFDIVMDEFVPVGALNAEYGLGMFKILYPQDNPVQEVVGHNGSLPGYQTGVFSTGDYRIIIFVNTDVPFNSESATGNSADQFVEEAVKILYDL